jgi:hypothetical protein
MKFIIRIPVVRIVVLKADIQTCRYHVVYLYSHNAKLGILSARAEGLDNIPISRERPSNRNDLNSRWGVLLYRLSVGLFGFLHGRYACRPVELLHVRPCGLSVGRSVCVYACVCERMYACTYACTYVCTLARPGARTRDP